MKRPSGPRPADTKRTPTHTHTVFPAPRNHLDVPFSLSRFFPLIARTPLPAAGSPGRRGFENHRPKTDHTYKLLLSPFFCVCCVPPTTLHTYVHSLSPLAITIATYTDHLLPCLRLLDYPFSESWCTELWNPAPDFLEFTLFRFDELTLIRQSRVRTPRTRTPETETRPAPKVARFSPVLCFSTLYPSLR